jgi:RNA polymerase sigma-70 factor (ECF subfamily)
MVVACYTLSDLEVLIKAAAAESVRAAAHSLHANEPDAPAGLLPDDLNDIKHTRDGDPEAYRRLVERHQDHVARLLWRFSRDRRVHEELVQDVFVEAYLSLGSYGGRAPFEHWLARIATRVGYRYWKERARSRKVEPFDVQACGEVTGDGLASPAPAPDQAAELLHQLLGQIPPRDRLILTLRYLDQCDVAETARRTGWTRTMVKVQTLRARNKLRKLIENRGTEFIR